MAVICVRQWNNTLTMERVLQINIKDENPNYKNMAKKHPDEELRWARNEKAVRWKFNF
jgi:glutathione peroxidase-family protein